MRSKVHRDAKTDRVNELILRSDSFADELIMTRIHELLNPDGPDGLIAVKQVGQLDVVWETRDTSKDHCS